MPPRHLPTVANLYIEPMEDHVNLQNPGGIRGGRNVAHQRVASQLANHDPDEKRKLLPSYDASQRNGMTPKAVRSRHHSLAPNSRQNLNQETPSMNVRLKEA